MTDCEFNTPGELIEVFQKLDLRGIGLDPCSNRYSVVDARVAWTRRDKALTRSWRRFGLVFLNPPHSMSPNNIEPWIEKAHQEFIASTGRANDQFLGLIPAKTDTAWFHDFARKFPGKCFLRGRPRFLRRGRQMAGGGKFASMVIYQGPKLKKFRELMEPLGWLF